MEDLHTHTATTTSTATTSANNATAHNANGTPLTAAAGSNSNPNPNRRKSRPPNSRQNKPSPNSSQPPTTTSTSTREGERSRPRPPRRPKDAFSTASNPNLNSNEASTSSSVAGAPGPGGATSSSKPRPRPQRRKKPPTTTTTTSSSQGDGATATTTSGPEAHPPPPLPPATGRQNRRAKFGSGLTKREPSPSSESHQHEKDTENSKAKTRTGPKPHPHPRHAAALPQGDDLTSSLTRALSTPPYPDCPICFSPIRPEHAIWSCSPSTPIVMHSSETQGQNPNQGQGQGQGVMQKPQYCWTSFHVRCIREWAEKSVRDVEAAWRARGEAERRGDWRCPGCQAKREEVPSGYWCFCHSTPEPKTTRLSTPHSCGNSCSRPRESGCGHPCPLTCHPGPCPPCQVTMHLECYCPRKKALVFRCGVDARRRYPIASPNSQPNLDSQTQTQTQSQTERDLSCGEPCLRPLSCGKPEHRCQRTCHPGQCAPCEEREVVRCWCGKETKDVACGEGEGVRCYVEGEGEWVGRFGCARVCDRPFDCGIHKCQKPCHPPSSKPAACPRSPSLVTHCPCGRCTIAPAPSSSNSLSNPPPNPSSEQHTFPDKYTYPEQYTFPPRLACTDPIPTCTSPCSKLHLSPACGHLCAAPCHEGACPPCAVQVVRPCRCGSTTRRVLCSELVIGGGEMEILCDKPCNALRACGRHQCRRICCPLASLALAQHAGKKGKKRAAEDLSAGVGLGLGIGIGEEQGGLHECDLVCGKLLSCGIHKCERRDHKGACGRCLRSSFEELICTCGRTVYEPPIPCGTRMECHYPCSLPPPACGHPRVPHECHPPEGAGEGGRACPPCPHLTTKRCACGKKEVGNVRCSLEAARVSCGSVCGKLMKCGFHHCERLCHADDCGPCTATCGKARKSCLPNIHPCTLPCHAPSSCPETEPCQALVQLTCACGRLKQSVYCGRTVHSPAPSSSSTSSTTATATQAPKCNSECQIAKRNARLADALGISVESREREREKEGVSYGDELVGFARVNGRFLGVVEKAFADFVNSEKRTQVLPHMPPDRRKFVHDLAAVYRMDTQMVDQEPHRSVQLLRRIDTRIPSPLLSAYLASGGGASQSNLGRLADFRSLARGGQSPVPAGVSSSAATSWRASSSKPQTPVGHGGTTTTATASTVNSTPASRGWTSVVAPKPTATLAGHNVTSSPAGGSLGNSRTGSPAGLGVGGGGSVQRSSSSSNLAASAHVVSNNTATANEPVPDNWEDDV